MELKLTEIEKTKTMWICDFDKDVFIRKGETFNLGLVFFDYKTEKFVSSCVGISSDNMGQMVTFTSIFENAFESFLWMEAKLYSSGFPYSELPSIYKLKEKYKDNF